VGLDGVHQDKQGIGNLLVAQAGRQLLQYLQFPLR
jgi:hypothetical protein